MKKTLPILITSILLLISLLTSISTLNEFEMTNKGNSYLIETRANLFVGLDQNFTSIQDAINAASPGDTIFVFNGTYYENIIVNKTVSIVGNSSSATIIDGGGSGDVIIMTANSCALKELSITGGGSGLIIDSNNNKIESCVSIENYYGVRIDGTNNDIIQSILINNTAGVFLAGKSEGSYVSNCFIKSDVEGISIVDSINNVMYNNTLENCGICFKESFWRIPFFEAQTIPENNTVNGKSIFYWKNKAHETVPNDAGQIILANCNNITIENQDLSNCSVGIQIRTSDWNSVVNSTFESNSLSGINLDYYYSTFPSEVLQCSNFNIIDNCTFKKNGFGLQLGNLRTFGVELHGLNNNEITNCVFDGNNDGIFLSNSKNTLIKNCHFENSNNGIFAYECVKNSVISETTCTNNSIGIYLGGAWCSENRIEKCILKNNSEYGIKCFFDSGEQNIYGTFFQNNSIGIKFDSSSGHEIYNNTFTQELIGILCYWSSSNTIANNQFIKNKWVGIVFDDYSNSNLIYYNNFIIHENWTDPQATDWGNNNKWNIEGEGNYWSDWTSPDNNSDGIVDIPYRLNSSKNSKDYYPLTDPYGILKLHVPINRIAYEDAQYFERCYARNTPYQKIWSFSTNASWIEFLPNHTLKGTPTNSEVGSYWVNIEVSDGTQSDQINFTISVIDTNDPPRIITNDIKNAIENEQYSVDYKAEDIDLTNDILRWDVTTNASFLTMNRTSGVLEGIPRNNDVGSCWVNVTVDDGRDGIDFSNFTMMVHDVNNAPEINRSFEDISFLEDSVDYSINLNDWFKDSDNDPLVFGYNGNNKVDVRIYSNGIVELIPEANWSGEETLTFYAIDSSLEEISDIINITIIPVNDAPYDASILLVNIESFEGKEQTVFGNASDVDIPYGDILTYTWTSNRTSTIIIGQKVNLSLINGLHKITLNVTDNEGYWCITFIELNISSIPILVIDDDNITPNDDEIVDDDTQDDDKEQSSFPSWFFLIALGLLVLIIIAVVTFVIIRRNKSHIDSLEKSAASVIDTDAADDDLHFDSESAETITEETHEELNDINRIESTQEEFEQIGETPPMELPESTDNEIKYLQEAEDVENVEINEE